jgi:hypothetical protein
MWESKDQTLDINYNVAELWFLGVYGVPVPKPTEIKKWEEGKCYLLLDRNIPRLKADRMLQDLSQIALKYAQGTVHQRLTLKPNAKGENRAPVVFQYDSGGDYLPWAVRLLEVAMAGVDSSEDFAEVEPLDGEADEDETPRTTRFATPARAAGKRPADVQRKQREMLDTWIDDPQNPLQDKDRPMMELYCQLTEDELVYVHELQKCYDESRCYFVQWILSKETKELVNSARVSAIQAGQPFAWKQCREEILKSLTDVTLTARFLALSRLRRKQGSSAKLWVSQVLTRRALLEDPQLPTPITLPETLYLELTLGQMSPAETTVFNIPAIGDDLSGIDGSGEPRYTMARIERAVDACSNPPQFRGAKTPITGLLDPEDKGKREPPAQGKDKRDKLQSRQNTARDHRPAHEKPANFPPGLKRPDPTSTVDGRKISNDAQRQLFDDIKANRCTRCHKDDHHRAKCSMPAAKWEEKFDREKVKYWESVLKWQTKAADAKKDGTTPPTPKPTLIPKKESRRTEISIEYLSDDDETVPRAHALCPPAPGQLQCRMHYLVEPDSDDESVSVNTPTTDLPGPLPTPLAPAPATDPAADASHLMAALGIQPQTDPRGFDEMHTYRTLFSAPFITLHRGTHLTTVLFDDGRSRVVETAAVDVFTRLAIHTKGDSNPSPPAPPPPPPPLLSPAPSPAFTWRPSWQPFHPPTPYLEPESPPTSSTPRDITYQHGASDASFPSSSAAPAPAPLAQWRQAQEDEAARPIVPTPWQMFRWGNTDDVNQEPEPWGRASRASSASSSGSSPHSYAHTRSAHRPSASTTPNPRSSFRGGTTVIATASARDPSNPDPVAILPILVGLDSYSDVTVAAPDLVYNKRKIMESVGTGAGSSEYFEEGFIDIADGLYSFRTLPALVASSPHHLPSSCSLLLGVPQLNALDIRVDVHRKQRNLPLSSYDPEIILAAESPLECRLSEKELAKWATHNVSKPVGSVPYSYLDIDVNPALSPAELAQIRNINERFQHVFDASQGALPTLADHPPVTLNFKPDWKHVSVPQPRWGPGATAVLTRWAEEMLASGLYEHSQSASASRPHIVKKTPANSPKNVDITKCGLRICGDYRRPNDQLLKSVPTTPNGTEELAKLPGYTWYWSTDRFSMYNAFALARGPSRQLLALHTPLGLLEPTRMVFGEMNAGTVACSLLPAQLRTLPNNAYLRTAAYVDDNAQGAHTFADLLAGWTDYLTLCAAQKWQLNATKTSIGYSHCIFFGFEVNASGVRLADKNLDPIRRMVPPTNLHELRSTLGVFVQSSRFIPNYAHITHPLTHLTRSSNGKPVPFVWTADQQQAYDKIRDLLLDGIHLCPANYLLPFHCGGDASNDGKAFGIHQYSDLPPGTPFTVTAHSASETTVLLSETATTHTIPHNDHTRRVIAWFSKTWSDADRKRAPFYLEADALLWGLSKCRFWALSSPFPLYASSDHLPLKWVRHCEKGPVSAFTIEQLSDINWVHSYIKGPDNTLFDALSRYPLLGPRVLAPTGLSHAVSTLLDYLPPSLRAAAKLRVFAPPHTQRIAQQVQAWRIPTNPIDTHSLTHRSPPDPTTDLIITSPRPEDAPRIAARLLSTTIPFALLLPSDLAPRISDANHFDDQPCLRDLYKHGGKIMFLDSDFLWFIGNVPELSDFSQIFAQVLDCPPPLLSSFASSRNTTLPSSLQDWKAAQLADPTCLDSIDPDSLASCNGLHVYRDPDFPSRILVPPALREPLTRQHHADLHHISHPKVHTSLARHYYWPSMKSDIRRWLEDCAACENEKGKRRLAHGLFAGHTTAKPRSRYSMDFQGQGLAITGETEALAVMDSFTKTVFVLPLKDRTAPTFIPPLLDAIWFTRGSPDVIHSDAAPELLSSLLAAVLDATGTQHTTTCGHNAQSNGEIESWWRFWNRCMKLLSPDEYLHWPLFSQRICFAHNSVSHESLGGLCPFSMDFGSPPASPFFPAITALPHPDDDAPRDDPPSPISPTAYADALRTSSAAFHRFASSHHTYVQATTAKRLNQHGTPAHFALHDRVKIYMPPTHAQIQRTGRRAQHIVAWRGPCVVTEILSASTYRVQEECSKRFFERSIINMRPYRATSAPPPPHHDLLSTMALTTGTLVAVRDSPTSAFHLARITALTEANTSLHYLGTTNPRIQRAVFKLLWLSPDNKTVLKDTRPARNHHPITGEISSEDLPDLLVATHLSLTSAGRLSRPSYQLLHHLHDQLHIY